MVVSFMNIAMNFVMTRWLGVYGVVVTSIVTYLVLLLYRFFDMARYVKLKLQAATVVPIVIGVAGMLPFYLDTTVVQDVVFLVIAIALVYMVLPRYYRNMLLSKFHIGESASR